MRSTALGFAFIASFVAVTPAALALDISAFYVGSCRRVVGIPLRVDDESIEVLAVNGDTTVLPRHEINLIATYPSSTVPFRRITGVKTALPLSIMTWRDRKMVELVRGWPVEFTQDKIAFLTLSGRGFVLDRSSIWQIETLEAPTKTEFYGNRDGDDTSLVFVHPQILANCPLETVSTAKKRQLVAQQLLSEPITIKRELDRLQKGHEVIDSYRRKQAFFPVPALYGNQTSLQLWTSIGSRYGSSKNRSNNFTPLVKSEHWTGPFLYQHQFMTGSGLHIHSLHDEPQTLAAYQFKADYIQFGVMSDLQFLLIGGEKYRWREEDIDGEDLRLNDTARVFAAIDYGRFSLLFLPTSSGNVGVRYNGLFVEDGVSLPLFGFSYRVPDLYADFITGSDTSGKMQMSFFRANIRYQLNALTQMTASYISRAQQSIDFIGKRFDFDMKSQTVTASIEHLHRSRFPIGGYFSVEQLSGRFSGTGLATVDRADTRFKAGVMVGINF